MPLYDFTEFLKLSSVLNYNLSAASLNRYNILLFIIEDKSLDRNERIDREQKSIIMEALNYLFLAYSEKRRRLGPMAVLHPLRTAALFSRARDSITLVQLLTAFFHDILEDINPLNFERFKWIEMESLLYDLFERLGKAAETDLVDRLCGLTRLKNESYYEYIGRLLDDLPRLPELDQIKMADRLDNTLDMRVDLQDPIEGINFFKTIFQVLFVNNYQGYRPAVEHPPSIALNGARRLYQLFKNAVLMSLIRQKVDICQDSVSCKLFDALADASLLEAQRTLIHLLGYHIKDPVTQRELALAAMDYCYSGRSDMVTEPDGSRMLDGLFSTYFAHTDKAIRNRELDRLYQDKMLMVEASIAFIVIFLSFQNDSDFYVKGISAKGISAQ
jgi:hypothetical protein